MPAYKRYVERWQRRQNKKLQWNEENPSFSDLSPLGLRIKHSGVTVFHNSSGVLRLWLNTAALSPKFSNFIININEGNFIKSPKKSHFLRPASRRMQVPHKLTAHIKHTTVFCNKTSSQKFRRMKPYRIIRVRRHSSARAVCSRTTPAHRASTSDFPDAQSVRLSKKYRSASAGSFCTVPLCCQLPFDAHILPNRSDHTASAGISAMLQYVQAATAPYDFSTQPQTQVYAPRHMPFEEQIPSYWIPSLRHSKFKPKDFLRRNCLLLFTFNADTAVVIGLSNLHCRKSKANIFCKNQYSQRIKTQSIKMPRLHSYPTVKTITFTVSREHRIS